MIIDWVEMIYPGQFHLTVVILIAMDTYNERQ